MASIEYETRDFPTGNVWGVRNGYARIDVGLSELLHAAITVGHSGWSVLWSGRLIPALSECLWKASSVVMTVRRENNHFYATERFEGLDPSEKRGATYQLGLTITKLFAQRLFGASHLLHLDVYKTRLNPSFQAGTRSRPDLVGEDLSQRWLVFESKGRASTPSDDDVDKAKGQAERVTLINGTPPSLRAAMLGYFQYINQFAPGKRLQAIIADPDGTTDSPLEIKMSTEQLMQFYYEPLMPFFTSNDAVRDEDGITYRHLEDVNLRVGIATKLLGLLKREAYSEVMPWIVAHVRDLEVRAAIRLNNDGVVIDPGEHWTELANQK